MECEHFVQKTPDILPNTKGCQECEVEKTPWVAIRMCLTCGHVGCCDSSVIPNTLHTRRSDMSY